MKKFRFFAYAALAMTGLTMTSCSEEDNTVYATPGSFGELTIDRTTIGTHQWFTISGSYVPGKDVTKEDLSISIDGGLPISLTLSKDNKFSVEMALTKSGTHKVTVSAANTGIFHDGEVQQTVEKSTDVNVVASDIRCHFWGDSRETTNNNLKYYKTLEQTTDGFRISEEDMYGTVSYFRGVAQDVSQSTISVATYGDRTVEYIFDTNDKLSEIQYICTPSEQQVNEYAGNLGIHVIELMDEYEFSGYGSNGDNLTLTPDETAKLNACLDQLNNGTPESVDADGSVGSLIKNKGLMLFNEFISKDRKTQGYIGTFYNNSKLQILIDFTPAN